jgi:transposase
LEDFWLSQRDRFPQVKTLLLNLDNGPDNHSRRTQFMKRITDFADTFQVTMDLAYYPPYHSKYNPIERVWGVLEQHWNGGLLDTCETVLKFAQTMIYKGQQPVVKFVKQVYHTGVKLTQKEMTKLEKRFDRLHGLSKWFVRIAPTPSDIW